MHEAGMMQYKKSRNKRRCAVAGVLNKGPSFIDGST
jgi:hypothetical protein